MDFSAKEGRCSTYNSPVDFCQEAKRTRASHSIQGMTSGEGAQAENRHRLFKTYSPVANINSIRVGLATTIADAYVTQQLDADTAFLINDLKERVYMEVPHGIDGAKNKVCQLDKAIYGLKKAASA